MHMVIAILAKIGTRTFAVAVFDATLVIVTCKIFYCDGKGPKAWKVFFRKSDIFQIKTAGHFNKQILL